MRKVMLLLLVLVVLPGATAAHDPPARDVELAEVIGVADGDTIEVDIEGRLLPRALHRDRRAGGQ